MSLSPILATTRREPPIRHWVRENSIIQQGEKISLIRRLCLEVPEDLALRLTLVRIKLALNKLPRVVPVRLALAADARLAGTGAVVIASHAAVVAVAFVVT